MSSRLGCSFFLTASPHADQWYLNLFSFLENRRLAHVLNRTVNISIAFALFLMLKWGASIIVAEISYAQL